ncbi:hypothetical protein RIF29_08810 [Crotalaria pallida]|uniref:BTB domain-containing protein n=1 Tax=Crotalaria pallida TaxID=3830 RepID=A0AAN9IJE4_CROPI
MICFSCRIPSESGTCKKCYEEVNMRKDALRHNIEELKSKVNFLTLFLPMNPAIQITSDVVLVPCSGSSIAFVHAHKFVSRSPVFKAMFENDMDEGQSVINVADVAYDALRTFVIYLYTAEVCLEDQMAFDLFILAEKYQVNHLKAYCEKFLIARVNEENAISNYTFAQQHNAKQLLDSTLTCIADNKEQFVRSEAYVNMKHINPRLVVDILEACFATELLVLP